MYTIEKNTEYEYTGDHTEVMSVKLGITEELIQEIKRAHKVLKKNNLQCVDILAPVLSEFFDLPIEDEERTELNDWHPGTELFKIYKTGVYYFASHKHNSADFVEIKIELEQEKCEKLNQEYIDLRERTYNYLLRLLGKTGGNFDLQIINEEFDDAGDNTVTAIDVNNVYCEDSHGQELDYPISALTDSELLHIIYVIEKQLNK